VQHEPRPALPRRPKGLERHSGAADEERLPVDRHAPAFDEAGSSAVEVNVVAKQLLLRIPKAGHPLELGTDAARDAERTARLEVVCAVLSSKPAARDPVHLVPQDSQVLREHRVDGPGRPRVRQRVASRVEDDSHRLIAFRRER
jgi:hypothetical protein